MDTNIPNDIIPRHVDDRREWIKYQLALRGLTLGLLANRWGLSRKTVQKALHTPYPRMEKLIAEALGHTPQELWPERYDPVTGKPNRRRGRPRGQGARKKSFA